MEMCNAGSWMHWSSWAIYIIFMIFAIKWMYNNYAKSPLDRAIERLSADAIEDIQNFLDEKYCGEVILNQYLQSVFRRLTKSIEKIVQEEKAEK